MERFKGRIRSSFRGKKVFRSKSFRHLSLRRKKGKANTDTVLIVPNIIGKIFFVEVGAGLGCMYFTTGQGIIPLSYFAKNSTLLHTIFKMEVR